jgi:hypothetical protein
MENLLTEKAHMQMMFADANTVSKSEEIHDLWEKRLASRKLHSNFKTQSTIPTARNPEFDSVGYSGQAGLENEEGSWLVVFALAGSVLAIQAMLWCDLRSAEAPGSLWVR